MARERYRADGLSETATNVLLSSWSDSTQKRYSGPWNAWSNWCLAWSILSLYSPCEQRAGVLDGDSQTGQTGLQNDRRV